MIAYILLTVAGLAIGYLIGNVRGYVKGWHDGNNELGASIEEFFVNRMKGQKP